MDGVALQPSTGENPDFSSSEVRKLQKAKGKGNTCLLSGIGIKEGHLVPRLHKEGDVTGTGSDIGCLSANEGRESMGFTGICVQGDLPPGLAEEAEGAPKAPFLLL